MNGFVRPDHPGTFAAKPPVRARVELSVVMVVYQTGPALAESVARVLADPDLGEFVIIDNGSSPDERALLEAAARDPRVILKSAGRNIGFACGANMGAAAAHGRVLVFLNPDAFLERDCLAELKRALEGQPSPCIVGARVLNIDGTEQRGARRGEITPVTALLSLTRLSKLLRLKGYEVHHEADPVGGALERVPTISGACFAVTAADFASLGGFDEGYFLHVEDVDLCWRARQSGGVVLFDAAAEVVHLGSTSHTAPVAVEYHKGVGLGRYFRKRADNRRRKALAVCLTPFIIVVSVARPILRGQALSPKAGLRPNGAVRVSQPTVSAEPEAPWSPPAVANPHPAFGQVAMPLSFRERRALSPVVVRAGRR